MESQIIIKWVNIRWPTGLDDESKIGSIAKRLLILVLLTVCLSVLDGHSVATDIGHELQTLKIEFNEEERNRFLAGFLCYWP